MFKLYALVNYQTCGWCRKFRPALETNMRAMNPTAQKMVEVVDLDTPQGKATQKRIGFNGGIPCLIATKNDQEVYRKAGYQDPETLARTLANLFASHVYD